ncbi:XisI protein [Candidatus Gracilibacteria bacterium]|nr:XisI protein [Candidatus Gracilibacteria bacterium]
MDPLVTYQHIIEQTLAPYTQIPYAYGELQCKAIFDRERHSYALVTLGWDGPRRVHGCLVHIEIINTKVWVQRDDTETGVTYDLVAAGIPKHQIVLGFQEPAVRHVTEYAVA